MTIKKKFSQKQISQLLKISKNYLFIDKAFNITPGVSGQASKKIYLKDWFLKSHFTNDPTMPGSLQIEAMLQTIVTTIYCDKKFKYNKSLIVKLNTSFYKKISKSGKIIIDAKILKRKKNFIQARAHVFFNKERISEGNFNYINV